MPETLRFTKMHGAGNDYIYFNCLEKELSDPAGVAVALSPRHHAVGADGIVMICKSKVADAKMRMFNADGSEGKMCGNAIRCVARYLSERVGGYPDELTVETLSGIKRLTINRNADGSFASVSVEMGRAILEGRHIPVEGNGLFVDYPIRVLEKAWGITAVSMGNPHAVTFLYSTSRLNQLKKSLKLPANDSFFFLPVKDQRDLELNLPEYYLRCRNLERIGPIFENHPFFPDRVNTEFVRWISDNELEMRVWERGSGETFACGTGACASVVAACITGRCRLDTPVTVHMRGGDLSVTCRSDLTVLMTGGAEFVFEGTCNYPL